MAEANLTAVRNEAANEIQKSRDTLAMKSTQIKHLYAGVVPRAQETVRATEFAYQHGASSLTDLLAARRALQSLLHDVTAAARIAQRPRLCGISLPVMIPLFRSCSAMNPMIKLCRTLLHAACA